MRMAGRKTKKIKKWLHIGREKMLSLLFPHRCLVCDEILTPEEIERGIHLICENKLYPVEGAVCMHCGRPLGQYISKIRIKNNTSEQADIPEYLRIESVREYCRECKRQGYLHRERTKGSAITQAKALYLYKGAVKGSMYRFKYANKREYAGFLARKAVENYGDWLSNMEVIVPVPMFEKKRKIRGYNQAEVFAKELSKIIEIPVNSKCVYRIKDTTPQKELSEQERKNNLENAFQKGESIVQYSHVLIVDDIYTTGCTAQAVANVLEQQGGCHIYLLSVCIGENG